MISNPPSLTDYLMRIFASFKVILNLSSSRAFNSKLSFINLPAAGRISFALTTLTPSSYLIYLIVLSPLAERQSAIATPLNFSPSNYHNDYFLLSTGWYSLASWGQRRLDWRLERDCRKLHFLQSVLVHFSRDIWYISSHAPPQTEQYYSHE